ncbi:MAG: RidA family protein [Cyclobacteriaceae bacterium]|nr:RidA family protein [Cyclobacteriaceae bacterium]
MSQSKLHILTGAKWENLVGYSRAVKAGNTIEVSGTVAIKEGLPYAIGDPYEQTVRILEIIRKTLLQGGADMADVVRTRMYVTDISQWEAIGRAHAEVFGEIKPATTMVEVKALISPEFLVEIEATAVITD